MYGFISGITDTNEINYCPYCGAAVSEFHGDGTCTCDACGRRFGVVESEEDEEE